VYLVGIKRGDLLQQCTEWRDSKLLLSVLDFKLSPCFECRMLSSGLFPGVCSLNANVSEHCVCSIFIPTHVWRWNRQSVPKLWHLNYRRRGISQKKAYDTFKWFNRRLSLVMWSPDGSKRDYVSTPITLCTKSKQTLVFSSFAKENEPFSLWMHTTHYSWENRFANLGPVRTGNPRFDTKLKLRMPVVWSRGFPYIILHGNRVLPVARVFSYKDSSFWIFRKKLNKTINVRINVTL
jgi:hypothetical protein